MPPLILVSRVQDCDHRADRKTILGNPFRMYSEDQRDSVCDQYNTYFEDKVSSNDPEFMAELRLIKQKALESKKPYFKVGCHCAPRRCHVDTIAYFLNNFWNSI